MTQPLLDFFDRMKGLLMRGDYDAVARLYCLPCPFYCGTRMQVMTDRACIAAMLRECCEMLARMGATDLCHTVVKIGTPRPSGVLVNVKWTHTDAAGRVKAVTPVRYLCGEVGGEMRIHLAEYDGTAPMVWTPAAFHPHQYHS